MMSLIFCNLNKKGLLFMSYNKDEELAYKLVSTILNEEIYKFDLKGKGITVELEERKGTSFRESAININLLDKKGHFLTLHVIELMLETPNEKIVWYSDYTYEELKKEINALLSEWEQNHI
jgi:hypothetical protein